MDNTEHEPVKSEMVEVIPNGLKICDELCVLADLGAGDPLPSPSFR
jgi:hypothetical protein